MNHKTHYNMFYMLFSVVKKFSNKNDSLCKLERYNVSKPLLALRTTTNL